jgi:hypothetical protein
MKRAWALLAGFKRKLSGHTAYSLYALRAKRAGALFIGLMRELSDQNAYARHLAAHSVAHSGAEWRRFSEERLRAKYMRAKCC